MKQKTVSIIGLSVKRNMGALQAFNMAFDENNKLHIIKGAVGAGKTTLQNAIKLGTNGAKTLKDKSLYGEIETETQLLDGDLPVFVGCKTNEAGKLEYVLYTKDEKGKIKKNPTIDGISATPAKYLEMLQTKLTWRMDELTSENPTTQKNILLELYQYKLVKLGVIFDKSNPMYKDSILGQIGKAMNDRDYADMERKQFGGIADDLKARGFDPDRPDTIPDTVDTMELQHEIIKLKADLSLLTTNAAQNRENALKEILSEAQQLTAKCYEWNTEKQTEHEENTAQYDKENEAYAANDAAGVSIYESIKNAVQIGCISVDIENKAMGIIRQNWQDAKLPIKPEPLVQIAIKNGSVTETNTELPNVAEINKLRAEYITLRDQPIGVDVDKQNEIEKAIATIEDQRTLAADTNKVVLAVDSFHKWRDKNEAVATLKQKYAHMLGSVDTGVDGLIIHADAESNEVYLTYNGAFDPDYFNNTEKQPRKIGAYSGTQKPIIALLVQSYLLSEKPKALRYMYIDNVPIDKKTRALVEDMCNRLDVTVFMNVTGDFTRSELEIGEVLVENGEVFF